MTEKEHPFNSGTKKLREYLENLNLSITLFCKIFNFDRVHITKILNADRRRLNIDLAHDLEIATEGAVPIVS